MTSIVAATRPDDLQEVGVSSDSTMNRHMLRNIQFQPLNVPAEDGHVGSQGRRRLSLSRRCIEISIDENLLRRKIGQHHRCSMVDIRYGIKLHPPLSITQDV